MPDLDIPSAIPNKRTAYSLYERRAFGNKFRTWNSISDLEGSGFTGSVTMRYKGLGGDFIAYRVPVGEAAGRADAWAAQGASRELIVFNESAPDHDLVVQGELMLTGHGLYLFSATDPAPMRDALLRGTHAWRLKAKALLESALTPASYDDLQELLDLFPSCVVEFSAYRYPVGDLPGRNAVVWEVRNY